MDDCFQHKGAVAMILAVNANTFTRPLVNLFVVALGFSLQKIAAQPFAITLGDPYTGNSWINFGGSINSFRKMLGPIICSIAFVVNGILRKQGIDCESDKRENESRFCISCVETFF